MCQDQTPFNNSFFLLSSIRSKKGEKTISSCNMTTEKTADQLHLSQPYLTPSTPPTPICRYYLSLQNQSPFYIFNQLHGPGCLFKFGRTEFFPDPNVHSEQEHWQVLAYKTTTRTIRSRANTTARFWIFSLICSPNLCCCRIQLRVKCFSHLPTS